MKKKVTEKQSEKTPVDPVNEEYLRMFSALGPGPDGFLLKSRLNEVLEESGILPDDPRVKGWVAQLNRMSDTRLDVAKFKALIGANSSLLRNVIERRLILPDFRSFCREITDIFNEVKHNEEGRVARYIPQLGRVNPELFGVGITTVSGQRFSIGDAKVHFCLESVSLPINYCLSLEENGSEKVRKHIGREPSGKGFNELSLNNEGLPHNPMINSGAIVCCALIQPKHSLADRFDYILKAWERLSGGVRPNFNNSVFLSERETADRNFALGYFMREKGALPAHTDLLQTLEFYFQCCSIESDVEALSVVAASLANGGICPTTGEKVFDPATVQHCLSLMASCGMSDYSGEFAFSIGLPSKSGVSGAIMVIVPNVMGIAIWSPRLDTHGNSVRGILFCQKLVDIYNFHVYESILVGSSQKKDPRLKRNATQIEGLINLCWAASQGDLAEVQNQIASGVEPNWADYDGRTALHLAASEGHASVVEYLITQNAKINVVDRWNGTPLTDAKRAHKTSVIEILENALKRK